MKCEKCAAETFLPFKCQYCGGFYCSDHRLPENHDCSHMEFARSPSSGLEAPMTQAPKTYEYTVTYSNPLRNSAIHFSIKEIKHLAVAALLVVGVGLSLALFSDFLVSPSGGTVLITFAVMFAASFFIHEIAHKAVAQKMGFWAEFRLTMWGAVLTLVSIASPIFKIIAPGAMMVAGSADSNKMGKISIAGPLTNIGLAAIFLTGSLLSQGDSWLLLGLGAAFNAGISLFNLIPFGLLDGFKIFRWSKVAWVVSFAASVVLTFTSYQNIGFI